MALDTVVELPDTLSAVALRRREESQHGDARPQCTQLGETRAGAARCGRARREGFCRAVATHGDVRARRTRRPEASGRADTPLPGAQRAARKRRLPSWHHRRRSWGCQADGKTDTIWIHTLRLIGGRIADLVLNDDATKDKPGFKVRAIGANKKYYAKAVLSLRARWNVESYAYDWRRDVDEASDGLAELIRTRFPDRPVHLVAHSMGGLVARNFILRHPALWESMRDAELVSGGRLVMLGTPNYGSFAIAPGAVGQRSTHGVVGAIGSRPQHAGAAGDHQHLCRHLHAAAFAEQAVASLAEPLPARHGAMFQGFHSVTSIAPTSFIRTWRTAAPSIPPACATSLVAASSPSTQ